MASVDPPSYSVQDGVSDDETVSSNEETQLVISPIHNDFTFQKGYLGADGEHAAVEGEVQIKSARGDDDWDRVSVALHTVEVTANGVVELSRTQRDLWKRPQASSSAAATMTPPSVLPFSLPLMQDAPQCIHTPYSSLEHSLTATLHSADGQRMLDKTVVVHTKRYSSASGELPIAPETRSVDAPTTVEAQIPRSAWRAGEAIPVYVTVPPPSPSLVLSEGIRLRNIRAELLQIVRVPRGTDDDEWEPSVEDDEVVSDDTEDDARSSSSSEDSLPPKFDDDFTDLDDDEDPGDPGTTQYTSTIAHSGAPCRFHRSRPIRIRLVLHPSTTAFTRTHPNHPASDSAPPDCALGITQSAVLHTVRFRLRVRATFSHLTARSERTVKLAFPLLILPPPPPSSVADNDETSESYRKKHDRPPTRTVRRMDVEVEPEPGPSDPPPPFFDTGMSGARLPTFLESEAALGEGGLDPLGAGAEEEPELIDGEGTAFGFRASEQYDGLSLPGRESGLPPDFAELLANRHPHSTGEGEGDPPPDFSERPPTLQLQVLDAGEAPPPPPPAVDDPSDPPPAIDTPFAAVEGVHGGPPPYLTTRQPSAQDHRVHVPEPESATGGPPPYVDLVPRH
ncbi:hypothetical protein EXIGLDRAFT_735716 [Exidia glandulosa HHB12029]|uniref:Uncharacterized protein n=1 Tax=Exidia glandulosa HHB12029 TaxID=1314781 RepID=A0A166BLJ1_EXIGL|nr:hypothetical protein EXIGLDRAFT_735716 [Exidia glandulosa HHB12029]